MRKSGLSAPVAALLSGFVTGAGADEPARDPVFLPLQPALSTNSLDPVRTPSPLGSVAGAPSVSLAGNPLWAIPLSEFAETSARPLFSPSRRPPVSPVAVALAPPPANPTPPAKGPDHPMLTLLGTIVSELVEYAVVVDETSHDVIRLKVGDVYDGWSLTSVVGRAAFFQRDGYRAATLALPARRAEGVTANGGMPPPVAQPVAIQDNSQMGVPPANTFDPHLVPETGKGGWRREPKEG